MTPRQKLAAKIGAGAMALAVPLVIQYEGLILRGYRDPVNLITACVGHTATAQMRTYTRQECEELLYRDLNKHADALECVKTPMTDGQKAAFLSFAFNVGAQKFCGSTLVKKANQGDMPGACAELSRWTYAGGRELPGLVKRRAAERALCERGLS